MRTRSVQCQSRSMYITKSEPDQSNVKSRSYCILLNENQISPMSNQDPIVITK